MTKSRKRLLAIGVGLLMVLVAFEAVLQVGAYLAWRGRRSPQPVEGEAVILCVGDSFTYGMGASDREANSYPAVLARTLEGRAEPVQVINVGWPGMSSATALARMPGWLEAYRPDLVYVLLGYNDFWSGADAVAAEADGFRLEFRTWRFAKLVAAWVRGGAESEAEPSAPAFLGAWHAGSSWFDFRSDHAIETVDGELDLLWRLEGDRMLLERRDEDLSVELEWSVTGDQLRLVGGPFGAGAVLQRGLPSQTAFDRGVIAQREGRLDDAVTELAAALEQPLTADRAAERLVPLLVAASGRSQRAREVMTAWEARSPWESDRVWRVAEGWLQLDALPEAFALYRRAIRELPLEQRFCESLTRAAWRAPDRAGLLADLDAALRRDSLTTTQRIFLIGVAVSIEEGEDKKARRLAQSILVGASPDLLRRTLRSLSGGFDREVLARACDDLSATDRERVLAAFDSAAVADDQTVSVLAGNLGRIVKLSRDAGAQAVLLDYPRGREDVAESVATAAEQWGVDALDVAGHFRALLQDASVTELFIADGHCNDAGYAELGRFVAGDAQQRLK